MKIFLFKKVEGKNNGLIVCLAFRATYISFAINLLISSNALSQTNPAPGGVSTDLNVWFKANAMVNETSGVVDSWTDVVSNIVLNDKQGSDATSTDPQIVSGVNGANFNPHVVFDGNDFIASQSNLSGLDLFDATNNTVFFVKRVKNGGTGNVESGFETTFGGNGFTLAGFFAKSNAIQTSSFGTQGTAPGVGTSTLQEAVLNQYVIARQDINSTTFSTFVNRVSATPTNYSPITHSTNNGRFAFATRAFNLSATDRTEIDIAEYIVFSSDLNTSDLQRVESYLALKYGITLAQSYLNSQGSTIWNASTNAGFNSAIFGIGQDDASDLDQRISKSVNASSILILANNSDFTSTNNASNRTSLGEGNFLVAGHNNGTVAFERSFENITNNLMNRVWTFDETGTVGNIQIAIAVSDIVVSTGNSLYAIISTDQTFNNEDAIVKMTSDGTHWSAEIDPADGNFMSFTTIPAPGGITSNIVAWLRSENGTNTTTDGEDVTAWSNSLPNPVYNLEHVSSFPTLNGVTQSNPIASSPPSYESDVDNLLNFHPTVLFNDSGNGVERLFVPEVNTSSGALRAQTLKGSTAYMVGRPTSGTNNFWASIQLPNQSGGFISETSSSLPLFVSGNAISFFEHNTPSTNNRTLPTGLTWEQDEIALLKVTIPNLDMANVTYNKNSGVDDVLNNIDVSKGHYHALGNLGASNLNGPFGNITETIIYDSPTISDADDAKIQSYLAIKYGITLDQSMPQPYVNSTGTEIYDADGAFDAFDNNIVGIGQDDASGLDQRISKSVNTGSVLILSNDSDFTSANNASSRTSLGDGNFLVTGHNGETITFERPFENIPSSLMNRVWAFDETGTVGNIQIAIAVSDITVPTGSLYAIISTDQTFNNDDIIVKMTSDGTHWSAEIDPADGNFMSFTTAIPAPGGISSNIVAWLRSENGTNTTTDGDNVTTWNNSLPSPVYNLEHVSSFPTLNGVTQSNPIASSPPSYESDVDNLLNFHPTVLFNDSGNGVERLFVPEVNTSSGALRAQTLKNSTAYMVGRPTSGTNDFWASIQLPNQSGGFISETSSSLPLFVSGNAISFFEHNAPSPNRSLPTRLTWQQDEIALLKVVIPDLDMANVTYNKNSGVDDVLNNIDVSKGHYHALGNWAASNINEPFGNIAETIIYDSPTISDADDAKIQSYLAIKYGITLDQTTAQSYVNSEGDTIWNASANAGFNSDIFGIGRDDNSNLDQRVSQSINSGTILTVALDENFVDPNLDAARTTEHKDNLDFFIIGNNGGNTSLSSNSLIVNHLTRISRTWRAQDVEGVDCLNYQFDLSAQETLTADQDWYVIIADDQNFTTNVEYKKLQLSSAMATVKIDFSDDTSNNFITLARLDRSSLDAETNEAVGISTIEGNWTPKGGNYLELNSNNKGFVITRVNGTGSISSPIEGMLIFDTSDNTFKTHNGSSWRVLANPNPDSKFCQ